MQEEKIKSIIKSLSPTESPIITPMLGDAGLRRYFRATASDSSYIITQFPSADEMGRFLRTSAILNQFSIPTPTILHRDLSQLMIIQSDLGKASFGEMLTTQDPATAHTSILYQQALTDLAVMQFTNQAKYAHWGKFSMASIGAEMGMSWYWFMMKHCNITRKHPCHSHWLDLTSKLAQAMTTQPYVLTHRDFHSRNLMLAHNTMYWIDYQDMLQAPMSYDAVSLCYDCYHIWPRDQQQEWLTFYWEKIPRPLRPELTTWLAQCRTTSIQRHCKALGIFARLYHCYNRTSHLKWIAPTIAQLTRNLSDNDPDLNPHLIAIINELEKRCVH